MVALVSCRVISWGPPFLLDSPLNPESLMMVRQYTETSTWHFPQLTSSGAARSPCLVLTSQLEPDCFFRFIRQLSGCLAQSGSSSRHCWGSNKASGPQLPKVKLWTTSPLHALSYGTVSSIRSADFSAEDHRTMSGHKVHLHLPPQARCREPSCCCPGSLLRSLWLSPAFSSPPLLPASWALGHIAIWTNPVSERVSGRHWWSCRGCRFLPCPATGGGCEGRVGYRVTCPGEKPKSILWHFPDICPTSYQTAQRPCCPCATAYPCCSILVTILMMSCRLAVYCLSRFWIHSLTFNCNLTLMHISDMYTFTWKCRLGGMYILLWTCWGLCC